MFEEHRPTHVIHLASVVGGVKTNKENVADFFTDNVLINTNMLYVARTYRIKKLISLIGTCAYPKQCQMPYEEITQQRYEEMLSGLNKLNFRQVKGNEAVVEKFCDGDVCEVEITA